MEMKVEILEQCPSCGSNQIEKGETIKDHFYSKEDFQIANCLECGLLFTQNRPDKESIGIYYDSTNYVSHDSSKKSLLTWVYQQARKYMLKKKFQIIRPFKPELSRILDYGAGDGHFVEYLLQLGKKAEGIEPSEMARHNFEKRNNKKLFAGLNNLEPSQLFQVITLWHVLEHIHDLNPTMELLLSHLESKGIIVIAVPNQKSIDKKEFGANWAAWDVPRHLYHWDEKSLSCFMEKFGLKRIYINQLPLDPFYIGLVSAKYADKNSLVGLYQGLRSYFHGKNNPSEGSTLLTIWMKN